MPPYATVASADRTLWKIQQKFYEGNGYRFVWVPQNRPTKDATELVDALNMAPRDGFDPGAYDLQAVSMLRTDHSLNPFRRDSLTSAQAVDAELRLTFLFLKYASILASGEMNPAGLSRDWILAPQPVDLAGVLERALNGDGVRSTLDQLAPQHPQYAALRDALARYQAIADRGGWPTVPAALAALKPGAQESQLAAVRARLAASGDLPDGNAAPAPLYDQSMVNAIARFEQRHGLKADGQLDKDVIAAMNVPVEARIEQIQLNLERWRWLPSSLGERYILVNLPAFELEAYDGDTPTLSMRVIVGKTDSPTPVFADEMTTVVFSPNWNVPPSIARDETLPAVIKDPGYLERNNMELVKGSEVIDPATVDWNAADADFNFRFRQKPGTTNSLGLVKFVFPNHYNVYLHDTPADALFNRVARNLSHGCVRLQRPVDLAMWVLRDQPDWTRERVEAAMGAGTERGLKLPQPIPVYLVYQTAWVDRDGVTQFREDLYGHDAQQERLLREVAGPMTSASR